MISRVVQFLFEVGMLKKTPRSGFQFLGSGEESVAEHSFRTAIAGYALATMTAGADASRVVMMCLFHDLPEARTGDHNYVNKRYVTANESGALKDQVQGLAFGPDITRLIEEFNAAETLEARIAKDADQIDLILELKMHLDTGNPRAEAWLFFAQKRLLTDNGRRMAMEILRAESDAWWFDKETDWWVNGPENHTSLTGDRDNT